MQATLSRDNAGDRYRLSGQLTFRDRNAFDPVMADCARGRGRTIHLDLHELARTDSFGIGLFLVAHETAQAAGNHLVIDNVQGEVARVFHLANLEAVLALQAPAAPPAPPKPAARGLAVDAGTGEFVLSGRLTFADRERFEELVPRLLSSSGPKVVLDMEAVEFLDSAGLSMILIAREECEKRRLKLVIARPSVRVGQLLRLSALDELLADC